MSEPRRLLVVPSDPITALMSKGYGADWLQRYYNPAGIFDDVRFLNLFGERDSPLTMIDVELGDRFLAWRDANRDPHSLSELDEGDLREFFPGIPAAWAEAVREFNPDCIRAYDPAWSGLVAVELAAMTGRPLLQSVHNTRGICGGVVCKADLVLAVSEGVAARCIELGAEPWRVVTVNNRVDRELFSSQGPAADGPDGAPRLLSIARDHPQKNLDRLLEACAVAATRHPKLALVHLGSSGRDWSRWPFVTHLDSESHDEVPKWMRWADAVVMPSLWEGFGVVLAEALACGTPCVTSDRAPMNEIVTDGWDGLLVDPESVSSIADAITRIADPNTRARLAAPARVSSEPFDLSVIERRESALYRELTSGEWPLISVVLPTYNRAGNVKHAIENILAQSYPRLELIVVNDGSTDETRAVLDAAKDPRVTVIHRENGGLPRALNTGFARARGEYLTWTSDDNAYRPGALRAMARELEMDPAVGLVYADMEIVDEHGERRPFHAHPAAELDRSNGVGGCFLYRASVARAVGEYDPEFGLAEDYDYWLRMRRQTALKPLRRVLYDYADNPHSLSRRRFTETQEVVLRLMQREHSGRPEIEQRMYDQLCLYSAKSKQHGLPLTALKVALRAIRRRPASLRGWRAALRAITPRPLLKLSRRLRGLDAG